MHNANTLRTDNHDRELPLHMNRRARAFAAGATAIALLTGAGAAMSSNNAEAARVTEHVASQPSTQAEMIDNMITKGPDSGYTVNHIGQDESPSVALEHYASELSAIDNLGYVPGQQFATLESAKKLESDTQNATDGAVYPGEEIVTWRDDATGLIISQAKFDK